MTALDLFIFAAAFTLALALRPWQMLAADGPPWPWLLLITVMPLLWAGDPRLASTLAQAPTGACLLALMAGWPLAVIGMLPVAIAAAWVGDASWPLALHHLVWFGIAPASVVALIGAAIQRWLPAQVFVYILGQAFLATLAAAAMTGAAAVLIADSPSMLSTQDLVISRLLSAFGDAFLTGMLVAIFVAYQPAWLATWADRRYLRR
jgi:uncharacterized membrane protein